MNLNTIRNNLLNLIPIIKELYIEEFGEEYRQEFERKLNLTMIDLSNSFNTEYEFISNNQSEYSENDLKLFAYKARKEKSKLNYLKWIANRQAVYVIKEILGINIEEKQYHLFFDENYHIEGGIIDYFSHIANDMLNDPNTPKNVIDDILKKRQTFSNIFKINPTVKEIRALKENFKIIRRNYYQSIVNETEYGINFLTNIIEENFGYICSKDNLSSYLYPLITLEYNASIGTFSPIHNLSTLNHNPNKLHTIVRIPVAKVLKTYTYEDLVDNLIHELGHNLTYQEPIDVKRMYELSNSTYPYKEETNLLKEVINEYRAKRISKKIFPNTNQHQNNSSYDLIIPLIENFLYKHLDIFYQYDISNQSIDYLINIFGSSFTNLIKLLYKEFNKISFYSYKIIDNRQKPITYNENTIQIFNTLIDDIESYYQSNNHLHTKKKI